MDGTPRIVVVSRATEYEALLKRHGTPDQAAFFLRARGRTLESAHQPHLLHNDTLRAVSHAIPAEWRRAELSRDELSRFVFEPNDIIVAVGQDGLVANVAKYLDGQPVIGVNPDPGLYEGVLVRHAVTRVKALLQHIAHGDAKLEARAMVEAHIDDSQTLIALNEIFVGHVGHQSARYRIAYRGREEKQSSSGIIACTGSGATGWARSIQAERGNRLALPLPTSLGLAFMVREAFPGSGFATTITQGTLEQGESLELVCEQEWGATLFGDGIEDDRIEPRWGQRIQLRVAERRLHLAI